MTAPYRDPHSCALDLLKINECERSNYIIYLLEGKEVIQDMLFAVKTGIVIRSMGKYEIADELFISCLSTTSRFAALFELGVSKSFQGETNEAIKYFSLRLSENGLMPHEKLFFALQYARQGRLGHAERLLAQAASEQPVLMHQCLVSRQAFRFINKYDLRVALGLFEEVKSRFNGYSNSAEIEFAVMSALAEKKPFLFMRMGDGEGVSLRLSIEDQAEFNLLYQDNLEEFSEFWFGTRETASNSRFQNVLKEFNRTFYNADIIGALHLDGIFNEYKIGSRRGITWAVNTSRALIQLSEINSSVKSSVLVGDPNIHYSLYADGILEKIISSQRKIGLISCHQDLPAVLIEKFALEHVDFFKIPGEKSNKEHLGSVAVEGQHWPDRYEQILTEIRESNFSGQLFLVAAGMLGKIYASELKKSGAVVMDIGSIADALMKRGTRAFPESVLRRSDL